MRIQDHVAALRAEGELLARAAESTEPGTPVPTCPGWTMRDLVQHVGRAHRWAATYLRDARLATMTPGEEEQAWGSMPDDAVLASWFRHGHVALIDAIQQAPREVTCYTFLPASTPLAFWARRQAHETAVHRADAQGAHGEMSGVNPDFAVDGIDELLLCFFSRPRNPLRSDAVRTLTVSTTDLDASWFVYIGSEGARAERGAGHADCAVRGPASDLYLGLWNRRGTEDLEVSGDAALLQLWREKATVRWS